MAYYEILIPVDSSQNEVLIPYLEELGFNGYLEADEGLYAYMEEGLLDENALHQLLNQKFQLADPPYTKTLLPDKNWNKESELNFDPQVVDDKVLIKAPFHEIEEAYPYQITIEPAMAFGTGHHATTANMIRLQLETPMKNARVFDYGTGTGILAILAELQGSQSIVASEIQEDALRNTRKNLELNHRQGIQLTSATIEDIQTSFEQPFDVILANITRNTILESLPYLDEMLIEGGALIVSGYYLGDQELLNNHLKKHHFYLEKSLAEGKWGASKYVKAASQ